jgi:hypothetical protein
MIRLFSALFFISFYGLAQENDQVLLTQVSHDDQAAVDAIAMYPPEIRKDIFEVSKFPELIVRLNSMQSQTKVQFGSLLASFSKEEQEKIWNLTRYPSLISELANGRKKTAAEIKTILLNYPEEIHQTALDEGIENYNLLLQISVKDSANQKSFDLLLKDYNPVTVNAFHDIVKMPEILNTLYDNMQLTVVIGDLYKKNPEWVLTETDSINQLLTFQSKNETSDWEQSLTNDRQVQQQFTQSSEDYAKDNGYQEADYSTPVTADVTDYSTYPYNWWFGYPTWDPYAYWDPYPLWYDWGFYYGEGRKPYFFGLPSSYFMDWFFYYPENWSHYPELANCYYNYYNKHSNSHFSNPISRSVNVWKSRNSDVVNADWDKDNAGRTRRFKEFGQIEVSRTKYNEKHATHPIALNEYVQKYQKKFPEIKATLTPGEKPLPETPALSKRPVVKVATGRSQTKTEAISRVHTSNNQFRSAKQYHQSTWQNIRPQRSSSPPVRSARVYSAPMRSAPMRSTPMQSGGGGGKRR